MTYDSPPAVMDPGQVADFQGVKSGITLLDVRTPGEYASSHIHGSHNVPLHLLTSHARDIGAAVDGPVVLVCQSGGRARQAEQVLRAEGLTRLHVLDGGVAAWEAAGLPLNRGRQRWSMERQVRAVAGGLALAGSVAGLVVWRPLGGLAAGVGGGLLVSALTDTCTMARVLARLPYNRGAGCDVDAVVRTLGEAPGRPELTVE